MSDQAVKQAGSFGRALAGLTDLKAFRRDVLDVLRQEEQELLDPAWKKRFRRELPYWVLLDRDQQHHVRSIFGHVLPDSDISVESFDRDELVLLDTIAEQYIRQAVGFLEEVERRDFQVFTKVSRDYPGRIVILTLSASLLVFDGPDAQGKRTYSYQNIYGNRSVPGFGRCRLKGNLKVSKRVRSLEFHTSPVQMLAMGEAGTEESFRRDSMELHRSYMESFSRVEDLSRMDFERLQGQETSLVKDDSSLDRDDTSLDKDAGGRIFGVDPKIVTTNPDIQDDLPEGDGDGDEEE